MKTEKHLMSSPLAGHAPAWTTCVLFPCSSLFFCRWLVIIEFELCSGSSLKWEGEECYGIVTDPTYTASLRTKKSRHEMHSRYLLSQGRR